MIKSLCVIGDSITGGVVYVPEEERYAHFSGAFLGRLCGQLGIELHNHSKFGCTASAALSRMDRFIPDVSACDRTLVMLGGNDSDFDWPAVAADPEAPHECKVPPAVFCDRYGQILDRIAACGGTPVVMNPIPVDGRKYYAWISRGSDPAALMRFLHSTESIEHWNELYSLCVLKEAAARNIPVLDARSGLLRFKFFDRLFCRDGIHPSPEGHERLLEYLLPQAERLFA